MPRWINRLFGRADEAIHLQTGKWGEQKAARFLKKSGYKIIGQRVRIGKRDELDIIARHEGVLVFIEVKTRRSEEFGRPFSAVGNDKRKNLSRAAIGYLKKKNIEPDHIRFDVIEVIGRPDGDSPEIRHIENAFQLDSSYRLWW